MSHGQAHRRRIAMVVDSLLAGGAERIAVEVACSLDPERFDPLVLVTRHDGPLSENLRQARVPYAVLGRERGFSPPKYRRAHRLLRDCDLIHSHKWSSNMWGALLARTTGVPLIAREPTFSGVRTLRRTLGYRYWIAPVARRIVCPSVRVAESLEAEGVPTGLVEVIPNGVPLDAALPRDAARRELGVEPEAFVVGIVARLRPEKNHELLLDAAAQLRDEGVDVVVCVVGDGPRRAELQRRVEELGLAEAVRWAGERPDARRLVSAFDVGIICSTYEGLPVASLEILAAGVPLVATAVGALPEIVADDAGIVVPPGDANELARAIGRLARDRDLARELGARGRQRVEEEFSFERMARAFERVYEEVLGLREGGPLAGAGLGREREGLR